VHVCFVHQDSPLGAIADVPLITAEETEYGLVQYGSRPSGVVRVTHWFMPNTLHFTTSFDDPGNPDRLWSYGLSWRVPVDDEHHISFMVYTSDASGEAAARYRERQQQAEEQVAALPPAAEVGEAILAGRLRREEIGDRPAHSRINVQDYVVQVGQGAIADRTRERLGRSDSGVILLRRLWAREMQALAEGRPLKPWTRPVALQATTGL
jgi:5,5'-dehydrodivanillate O-demethylase